MSDPKPKPAMAQPHGVTKKYQKSLTKHGYTVLETSVHGKNQTRFLHFVLQKDDRKYFCKANLPELYETHINSGLVSNLISNPPDHVRFLAPTDVIEIDDIVFHVYPYIDQMPISNESAEFRDFSVDVDDMDQFFNRVIDAIGHVSSHQIVTTNEHRRSLSTQTVVTDLLKKLPNDTPYAMEFLKYILNQPNMREFQLAITDIQPQNMFWLSENKELIVFDLDALGPQLRYFDYVKFAVQLWVVYDKPALAKRFIELLLQRLTPEEKSDAYRYIRFNFTLDALVHYAHFKDNESRQRTIMLMKWIRRDLLGMMNSFS